MIKYMKTFGFNINNDAFENHSWYFRNALVRVNYNDFNSIKQNELVKYIGKSLSTAKRAMESLQKRILSVELMKNDMEDGKYWLKLKVQRKMLKKLNEK